MMATQDMIAWVVFFVGLIAVILIFLKSNW